MVINMMGKFTEELNMERESISIRMEINIKEIGKMINKVDMVYILLLMELSTKVIL